MAGSKSELLDKFGELIRREPWMNCGACKYRLERAADPEQINCSYGPPACVLGEQNPQNAALNTISVFPILARTSFCWRWRPGSPLH